MVLGGKIAALHADKIDATAASLAGNIFSVPLDAMRSAKQNSLMQNGN